MKGHPERTCVGCRRKARKVELLRVARSAGGAAVLDVRGHAPGRGGYLHADPDCLERAFQRGALARALRSSMSQEEAGRLRADIETFVRTH